MTQPPLPPTLVAQLSQQLLERQSSLRTTLQGAARAALADEPDPGADFKDRAEEQVEHALEEVASTRAVRELAEVGAALARLGRGDYGTCADCAEPIGPQRLLAMPAARYCAACQALHEHAAAAPAPHVPAARA